MNKPVILTGLRANNDLHIGNYFGAMLPLIDMAKNRSEEFQVNIFVPDLHSFTTPIEYSSLQQQIQHNLKLYVAAGLPLDNENVHIYRQSYIPAHSELTVILNNFTGFGEMSRMTQFKDKSGIQDGMTGSEFAERVEKLIELHANNERMDREVFFASLQEALEQAKTHLESESKAARVSVGLFDYPVLMAADILLYGATYVPVGDDQTQHLEITRDLGQRLNTKFNTELFTVPKSVKEQHEFFGKEQGLRIKDLVDPTKKMSKSDELGKGVIFLGDDPKVAAKKIMSATTDDFANIQYNPETQPGISNLLQILALLEGKDLQEIIDIYAGQTQYGAFKKTVADAVEQFLTTFQANLDQVNEKSLQEKLAISEAAMNQTANKTLAGVQKAVGLR
jgi:tryptophanyl-tRNA synthetase